MISESTISPQDHKEPPFSNDPTIPATSEDASQVDQAEQKQEVVLVSSSSGSQVEESKGASY
jgi:hypothetical protein